MRGLTPASKSFAAAPRNFVASNQRNTKKNLATIDQTPEKSMDRSGFLPATIQTTCAYSPDFAQVVKRDTRPTFLGG